MIHPGLLSITFRQLAPRAIVDLAQQAQLRGIEWGGDIHVPHGDLARAREVRALTANAGLAVSAYGSYYRVATSEEDDLSFDRVLETAVALGAPTIRIWAGKLGSDQAEAAHRQRVAMETLRVANLAAAVGLTISFEYHSSTLTDTNESAQQLLAAVKHPAVFTFWQPPLDQSDEDCVAGLRAVLPRLSHLHVYHWRPTPVERRPLAEGAARWRRFLDIVRSTGRDHFASLEFVRDDSPEVFLEDACVLREWLTR